MAKINFGGIEENVVTREEFPLSKALDVLKNETIAVGDSLNDLTMFEFASLPIASGNASKKIKEITKNVGCSNNEPIVKYILENFIK